MNKNFTVCRQTKQSSLTLGSLFCGHSVCLKWPLACPAWSSFPHSRPVLISAGAQWDVKCRAANMSWQAPVTVRNSVVPLPHTSSHFQYSQIQDRNFQLGEVWPEPEREIVWGVTVYLSGRQNHNPGPQRYSPLPACGGAASLQSQLQPAASLQVRVVLSHWSGSIEILCSHWFWRKSY